jgi:hypothetical protein
MIPKEKALELMDKFRGTQYPNFGSILQAKNCAIITANEIIMNCISNGCSQDWILYWEQVRYEIENL